MNVITKFLEHYSYLFSKGYPDLTDLEDKKLMYTILREIVEEQEMNESMLSLKSIQKRPDQFANKFYDNKPFRIGSNGEDEFIIDYVVIGNETFKSEDKEEKSNLTGAFRDASSARDIKLVGKLNGQETTLGISSIYKSSDLGGQEGGSRGVSNENELVNKINDSIESNNGPITVKFIASEGPEIVVPNVNKAEGIGYSGKKEKMKGDIMLYSTSGDQSISIKKDGPYWWSSERKQFEDLLIKFVEAGKNKNIPNLELNQNPVQSYVLDMIDPRDSKRYGIVLIKNYPPLNDENVINNIAFGSEKAKIVQRSFSDSDFNLENGVLTIKSTRNISDINDLTDDDKPIIWLARHENQKYGIDFRTIPYKQAKFDPKRGKTLVIDYNETPSIQ
jgi:hypothetical protein